MISNEPLEAYTAGALIPGAEVAIKLSWMPAPKSLVQASFILFLPVRRSVYRSSDPVDPATQ